MTIAVTYSRHGLPTDILDVTDVGTPPPPGPGQLQVQVTAFPIHPGDLALIAAVPATGSPAPVGSEATGVVSDIGPGVTGFVPGTRVSFFPHLGAWADVVNVDASVTVAVPDTLSDEAAAQMVCNPLTVVMLRRAAQTHFSVGFNGAVLNNAASSSVGKLFTAVAERHRIATISIVRSDERAGQLRQRFPTVPVVSTSARNWQDQIRDAAAGRPIPVALDPVGGAGTADLLSLLAPGGTVFVYGALADTDIAVHATDVLFAEKAIRGLAITRWMERVSLEQRASDLASAVSIASELAEYVDTAAVFPIDQVRDAVRAVTAPGKVGTVIVKF